VSSDREASKAEVARVNGERERATQILYLVVLDRTVGVTAMVRALRNIRRRVEAAADCQFALCDVGGVLADQRVHGKNLRDDVHSDDPSAEEPYRCGANHQAPEGER